MAWTTPKTWSAETLTSSDLNTHLRDNLNALKSPPTDEYTLNEGADYTSTSTSFVDIDATNLSLTIETTGGDVLVVFSGYIKGNGKLTIDVDGADNFGDDGHVRFGDSTVGDPCCICTIIQGLSAGSHTFKLQWRAVSGTMTLYAGAGTSNFDIHCQFWAREF